MKNKIIILLIIILMFGTSVFGYSSSFEYMLNSLNIEKQNVNGHFINEEIYNKYNLLVYGSPNITKKNQRWKNVQNGKWNKNGVLGEYWILRRKLCGKGSTQ